MRKSILSSSLLLISMVASPICFGVDVSNYYINGVNTSLDGATKSADKVSTETGLDGVAVLYNSTASTQYPITGIVVDLIESANMVFNWDDFYSDDEVNNEIKSREIWSTYSQHPDRTEKMDVVVFKYAHQYTQALTNGDNVNSFMGDLGSLYFKADRDVIRDIGNIVDFQKLVGVVGAYFHKSETFDYFAQDTQEYFDINNMLIRLNGDIDKDRGINIIAHSQGNLFANRLLDAFNQPNRVKLLSVATPDKKIYGELEGSGYTTLREDRVASVFVGEPPRNTTNFSDEYWASFEPPESSTVLVEPIPVKEKNEQTYRYINDRTGLEVGDSLGHLFIPAYMHSSEGEDSESKKFIVTTFKENYDVLKSKTVDELGYYGTGGADLSHEIEALREFEYNDYSTSETRLSTSTVERGEAFSVYTIQSYFGNKTDDELPSSRVGYYCSDDKYWDSKDHYLDRDSSSIGSDDLSDNERETLTIPNSHCNTGYILAVANYDDRIDESDKLNNVSYAPITIEENTSSDNQGDVYIQSPTVSDSILRVGTEYRLRSRQCYSGDQTRSQLGAVRMRYYISNDPYYSSDDDYLGFDDSTIGSDDECDTESLYWTPESSDKGTKYILFYADKGRDVDESAEDNNVKWVAVAIY